MCPKVEFIQNKIHPKVRLNSICPYFTMFPLSFPYNVLRNAKKNDIVYDPFCGRGTTIYAARLLGLHSFGVDSNPVAYAIAQAKLQFVKPSAITKLCEEIINETNINSIPEGEFWKWAFHESTLIEICKLRKYFRQKKKLSQNDISLRALILGILHGPQMKTQSSYLSNQMPRTFSTKPEYSVNYWKRMKLKPKYVDPIDLVRYKSEYFFNAELPSKVNGKIINGDSRQITNINKKGFNWIVTSPPYYGMTTYEQDQWLRKWFLGGPEKINYSNKSQINHGSTKSFTEDLSKVWTNTAYSSLPNAKLIIRFGALPSLSNKTPAELIKDSLRQSNSGWKIKTIRNAGIPRESNRQASQFKNSIGNYVEEIDVFAKLDI